MYNTNYTGQIPEKVVYAPQLCPNHLCDLEQSFDVPCYQCSCLQLDRVGLTDLPLVGLKFQLA